MDAVFRDSECCIYDKRSYNAPPIPRSCQKKRQMITTILDSRSKIGARVLAQAVNEIQSTSHNA